MTIKLGLFGADDSLEIMQNVVREQDEFDCLPIVFWEEDEVVDKIKPHANDVDMWLFSGQVPYSIAKEADLIQKPMFYVPHTGSGLYKALLQLTYKQPVSFEQVSFDTFNETELTEIFKEADLPIKPKFLKYYPGEINGKDLASYHTDLWKSGKTRAAVTCVRSAQLELQKLGVPVFRVLPTRSSVESMLRIIRRTNEIHHFKDTQIAVQMIVIDSFFGMAKESFSTDEIYKMEIRIMEKLLNYAKVVKGSVKSAGPGRYVIFTTRGLMREITLDFTSIPDLEELYKVSKEEVTCGIGLGSTAYEAEINAGKAILHARDAGQGSWFVFFEDKTIAGPLGKTEQIHFCMHDEDLQDLSRRTKLSTATLSKLRSILVKCRKKDLSAHELAQHMNIEPRSARRILLQLESNRLAEIVGEETLTPRGRPRNIYRIHL